MWRIAFLAIVSVAHAAGDNWKYVDPAQLDVPWPKHSFYKQPWRAFLETKAAVDFLAGVGVAYHSPGNDELALRLLAETGFRAIRIEIGWGSVSWDEKSFNNEKKLRRLMELVRQHGMRPTLLLNAHQGVPCPVQFTSRKLAADAPKGARSVRLTDTSGLVPGRSGISGLTDYWAAEALFTAIDPATGECQLSKPLPKDLPATRPVPVATLKYLPLHPADTKEFDETAAGWVRYALMACELATAAGINDFDVEIWNELTFGTKFLNIKNYYEKDVIGRKVPDFLNPGGSCWELARRTVDAVKAKYPQVRCIWGFSNTTFYHCAIEKLPPRTDGQSYHPYGTGTRSLPEKETHKDRPDYNVERYTPTIDIRMPEGWAHTFIQTECLMRLLNPEARKRAPKDTPRFYHYITEHGVVPAECGVRDPEGEWRIKTMCALRAFCLWLNKGIDVMHYFQAWDAKSSGMGLLPPDIKQLPADAAFDQVATPPMKAIRNLTRAFAGSVRPERLARLDVDVEPVGRTGIIFEGDARSGPLTHRDVFAFLPFQLDDRRLAIAVYVMTWDATKAMPPERYLLRIRGLPQSPQKVSLYDPVADRMADVKVLRNDGTVLEAEVEAVDYPRLLRVE